MENQWDKIRDLLLTYISKSLEEGEEEKGEAKYWIDSLQSFCKSEQIFKESQDMYSEA